MTLFTSSKEKKLWLYVMIVVLAIYATLVFGQPLQQIFQDQNVQAVIFSLGMALSAATVLVQSFQSNASKREIAVWLGLAAVYLMLFLRLGISERSHMIEYSVLAIFVFNALLERFRNQPKLAKPATLAILLSISIGIIDEVIQLFIPGRVFDPRDIYFNSIVIMMSIVGFLIIKWTRKKIHPQP